MDIKTAAEFVRELGATPSQAELVEYSATNGSNVTYEQLKELLAVSMYPKEDNAYLEKVLCRLSQDNTTINYPHFEYIMSNYGEPLTAEELAAVKNTFFMSGNNVPCSELATKLV
ncbi:myosin light chain TgMLC1, putative [Babesia caballi]|uniref:Myosin light chain TgMLC1, putative n=1 Tax=Babesia caballi TaxID=5871 RepID=A0AAV4LPI1_BABCB|nr:myosin light chain TgMLC1, putative [Babesia caballi]